MNTKHAEEQKYRSQGPILSQQHALKTVRWHNLEIVPARLAIVRLVPVQNAHDVLKRLGAKLARGGSISPGPALLPIPLIFLGTAIECKASRFVARSELPTPGHVVSLAHLIRSQLIKPLATLDPLAYVFRYLVQPSTCAPALPENNMFVLLAKLIPSRAHEAVGILHTASRSEGKDHFPVGHSTLRWRSPSRIADL
jgi:hypothetical protein